VSKFNVIMDLDDFVALTSKIRALCAEVSNAVAEELITYLDNELIQVELKGAEDAKSTIN
jgi:hypothetical protein